ncbi:MAG: hypothetical protein KDD55_10040, partial [Bdellovibrionales bacterium]|nr:hypothetical protein [Bdellovibrionales bacterium]
MVENTPSKKLPDPNDPDYSRQDALRDESLSKQAPRSSSSKSPGLNERQLRYIHDYLEDAIEVGRSASRRLPKFIRNDDIEGAALRGLYYAAKDFDPSRGIPFDRYLSIRVRGEILDETRRRDSLPRPTRIRLTLLNKTIQKLTQALERSPTPDEIYQRTNMTPTEQAQLLQAGGAAKQQVNASEGDEAWDTLPSIPDPSPQGDVLSSQMDLIDKAIRKL